MPFQLADMTLADYDEVVTLWRSTAGLGNVETPAEFAAYLDRNPGFSAVARSDGRLVGAVLCGHDGRRGYLYHLAVAADHRGQGIGRTLVDRCLDRLAAVGVARCSIHLYVDNELGQQFWSGIGWRERTDLRVIAKDL